MKPITADKASSKRNGYQSDDDNIRYKLNKDYFNNIGKSPKNKKVEKVQNDDENIRYKLPTAMLNRAKSSEQKPKLKQKIKVNFWSNKQSGSRLNNTDAVKQKTNRRHTVAATAEDIITKPKQSTVKVRKRVSFLPSPIFSENHIPMVTVPDDLTIQLNEEEANDLAEDLNLAFINNNSTDIKSNNSKRKTKYSNDGYIREAKRKRSMENLDTRTQGNENELEFFSKYVDQKLRRMETNQRIYSENLINTILMLGQLGKLNGKSKIGEA